MSPTWKPIRSIYNCLCALSRLQAGGTAKCGHWCWGHRLPEDLDICCSFCAWTGQMPWSSFSPKFSHSNTSEAMNISGMVEVFNVSVIFHERTVFISFFHLFCLYIFWIEFQTIFYAFSRRFSVQELWTPQWTAWGHPAYRRRLLKRRGPCDEASDVISCDVFSWCIHSRSRKFVYFYCVLLSSIHLLLYFYVLKSSRNSKRSDVFKKSHPQLEVSKALKLRLEKGVDYLEAPETESRVDRVDRCTSLGLCTVLGISWHQPEVKMRRKEAKLGSELARDQAPRS